jgi:hypothetical protein
VPEILRSPSIRESAKQSRSPRAPSARQTRTKRISQNLARTRESFSTSRRSRPPAEFRAVAHPTTHTPSTSIPKLPYSDIAPFGSDDLRRATLPPRNTSTPHRPARPPTARAYVARRQQAGSAARQPLRLALAPHPRMLTSYSTLTSSKPTEKTHLGCHLPHWPALYFQYVSRPVKTTVPHRCRSVRLQLLLFQLRCYMFAPCTSEQATSANESATMSGAQIRHGIDVSRSERAGCKIANDFIGAHGGAASE